MIWSVRIVIELGHIQISWDSQGGHGGALKKLKCVFNSHSQHLCGGSSVVECLLAKEKVGGSNPLRRSHLFTLFQALIAQRIERAPSKGEMKVRFFLRALFEDKFN